MNLPLPLEPLPLQLLPLQLLPLQPLVLRPDERKTIISDGVDQSHHFASRIPHQIEEYRLFQEGASSRVVCEALRIASDSVIIDGSMSQTLTAIAMEAVAEINSNKLRSLFCYQLILFSL